MRSSEGTLARLATVATLLVIGTPAAAQNKPLKIAPSIQIRYDSNVLRTNNQRSRGPRDNVRATVGVAFDYKNNIGVSPVFVRGTVGYDKSSRFSFLDRARVDISAGGSYALIPRCTLAPDLSFSVQQFDIEELGLPVGNTSTTQHYGASFGCNRPVGLLPVASIDSTTLRNSRQDRKRADRSSFGGTAGVAYVRPSLGRLDIYASLTSSERANILTLAGVRNVTRYGVTASRAVSPIIQASGGFSFIHTTAGIARLNFDGSGYSGQIRVAPIPRFVITGGIARDVNTGGFAFAYSLQRRFNLNTSLRFARNQASLNVSQSNRTYVGEDPLIFIVPRIADRIRTASLSVSRPIAAAFNISADVQYRRREARNEFYNYSSLSAGLSFGGRF